MPQVKGDHRVYTGIYLDRAQHAALRKLSDETRVPLAVYLRDAIDLLLARHKIKVPKRRARP
jgi:hypothetical protein